VRPGSWQNPRSNGSLKQFPHIRVPIDSDLAGTLIDAGEEFVADSGDFEGARHTYIFILVQCLGHPSEPFCRVGRGASQWCDS
jgi:hypothetical protein